MPGPLLFHDGAVQKRYTHAEVDRASNNPLAQPVRPGVRWLGARTAEWAAAVILFALPFIVYLPVATGHATFAGFDHTGINQPLKQEAFATMRAGDLPLWEPRLDRGLPPFAEGEAGVFYPLNLLFLLPVDFLSVYNVVLLLLLSAGGLLFYWWVRRLGAGPLAAFLAGVAHQWGATVNFNKANMNILEGYILAPLLLLLLEPSSSNDRPWLRAVGISAVFAAMIFAGQAQYVAYTGLFALVYIILRILLAGANKWRSLSVSMGLPFVGGALLGLGLAAVQLLPTLELIPLSERGSESLEAAFAVRGLWLAPNRLFATFIFPAYHISLDHFLPYLSTTCWVGPVPILLAGYAIRARRGIPAPAMIPLLIAGLIFLYLAMGANAPLAGAITSWGPLGLFRGHGRLAGYFALAVLALMALGLDALLKAPCTPTNELRKRRLHVPLFSAELIGMALLAIPFITRRAEYLETRIALALMIGFLLFFFAGYLIGHLLRSRVPIAVAVALILAIQIIGFQATSSETLLARSSWDGDRADLIHIRDESASLEEATLFAIRTKASVRLHERILARGMAAFEPGPHPHIDHLGSANAGLMEDLRVCNADLPLELARWEWLVHRHLWQKIDSTEGPLPDPDARLLWILGVNWLVTENGNLEITGFEQLLDPEWMNGDMPYHIYRRESPVRPYAVYWDWVAAPEGDEQTVRDAFLGYLDSSSVAREVFLEGIEEQQEGDDFFSLSSRNRTSTVSLGQWKSNTEYSATVNVSEEAIFVLRDAWYPGWTVTVNGQPAELLRADLVYKAVKIPAGRHEVVFRYRSRYLGMGWWVSGISLLLLIAIVILRGRLPRQRGLQN